MMKKKLTSLLLVICMVVGLICLPLNVVAATSGKCGDNITWTYNNGTLTLSGSGSMYDYGLVSNNPWLSIRADVRSIVISNGITTITPYAFYLCENATSVTIGNSVTLIDTYAFCFCESLESIIIPNSVKTINKRAFYGCENLSSVKFGSGLKSIGDEAFSCCDDLRNISIPNNVTSLGESCFSHCYSLLNISYGTGITKLPDWIFSYCTSLEWVSVGGNIETIGQYAFAYCEKLEGVQIAHKVHTIDRFAFANCSSLSTITMDTCVTTIIYGAFYGCSKIQDVYYTGTTLHWGNISIDSSNTYFTNANIHYLGNTYAVVYESNYGNQYTLFSQEKQYDVNLTLSSTIPARTGYIFKSWNTNTSGTGTTYSPGTVYSENEDLTLYAQWTPITYTVKYNGNSHTSGSMSNSSHTYDVSKNLTSNGFSKTGYSFKGWSKEPTGTVSYSNSQSVKNLTTVNGSTFNLYAVWEPIKATMLNYQYPQTTATTNITKGGEYAYFTFTPSKSGTYSFESTLSGGDTYGYLYDANGKQLDFDDDDGDGYNFKISYELTGGTTYYYGVRFYSSTSTGSIPVKLTSDIQDVGGIQYNCGTNLVGILDEDGTLTIRGSGEMDDYTSTNAPWNDQKENIKKVVIENGVTTIGTWAFSYCSNLSDIQFGNSLTEIGLRAFTSCKALSTLTIPDNVTIIGDRSFANCDQLQTIDLGQGVTLIDYSAFYNCSALVEVVIPDSVSTLGDRAFGSCSSLTDVTIGSGLKQVSNSAFHSCSALKNVVIPTSITSIGSSSFHKCTAITDVYYYGTSAQWAKITLGTQNTALQSATLHYNYTGKKESYTIIYNANGGSGTPTSQTAIEGTRVTITAIKPTRPLYVFLGWATSANATEAQYQPGDSYTITGNITLYAVWETAETLPLTYQFPQTTASADIITGGTVQYFAFATEYYGTFIFESTLTGGDTYCKLYDMDGNLLAFDDNTGEGNNFRLSYTFDEIILPYYYEVGFSSPSQTGTIPVKLTENIDYSCGDNLTWSLEGTTLTISGTGAMYDEMMWAAYWENIVNVVIEDGVTTIGENAFGGCFNLRNVSIPDSVIRIGSGAFAATALENVTIPSGVDEIENGAFSSCSSLMSVKIRDGVSIIGENAFSDCSCLTSITIPSSVTSIQTNAFSNSFYVEQELTDVYYGGTQAQWNDVSIATTGNDALGDATIHYNLDQVYTKVVKTDRGGVFYSVITNDIPEGTQLVLACYSGDQMVDLKGEPITATKDVYTYYVYMQHDMVKALVLDSFSDIRPVIEASIIQ